MAPAIGGAAAMAPGAVEMLGMAGAGQSPAGGGAGAAANAERDEAIGAIRELGTLAMERLGKQAALASELQELQGILRRMLIKAVQTAPTQTASADALPMAGA